MIRPMYGVTSPIYITDFQKDTLVTDTLPAGPAYLDDIITFTSRFLHVTVAKAQSIANGVRADLQENMS